MFLDSIRKKPTNQQLRTILYCTLFPWEGNIKHSFYSESMKDRVLLNGALFPKLFYLWAWGVLCAWSAGRSALGARARTRPASERSLELSHPLSMDEKHRN